ncbi:hypothetical protein NIES2100_04580 [Calothrix sp. NIES-2100]|nr:hypothetical protein NIES2100_04580 [Calothrix sp. NIES-2100]
MYMMLHLNLIIYIVKIKCEELVRTSLLLTKKHNSTLLLTTAATLLPQHLLLHENQQYRSSATSKVLTYIKNLEQHSTPKRYF